MSSNPTALLIEIQLPDGGSPLRLMSGQGFSVLRTDSAGREVYGLRHEDEEYLFYPMDFQPLDAGVLGLRMPSSCEEYFLETVADGARISFKAPHGSPFFAEMPEEYWSSAGFVRLDKAGTVTVALDKIDPAEARREQKHGDCGCGRHQYENPHDARRRPAPALHFPDKEPHADCACGHDHAPAPASPDAALADAIRDKARELNSLIVEAKALGLHVSLALEGGDPGEKIPARLNAAIFKPL